MSKIYDTIYQDNVRYIDFLNGRLLENKLRLIMYHFISIDNHFLFAEEISTGCIFPVGAKLHGKDRCLFGEFSYVGLGNFYIYGITDTFYSNIGEIAINEEKQKNI